MAETDLCWPVDHACCQEVWDKPEAEGGYTAVVKARADALAVSTLRLLTGFRVGGCPVTARPCRAGCLPETWATFPVGYTGGMSPQAFHPVLSGGVWLNMGCGCAGEGCSCTRVCEVVLYGEVGSVEQVKVDGTVLDPSAYRLDPPNRLVRTDADCWPLCQNMEAADDQPGTFAVTYTPGLAVDPIGSFAAGLLACEFAKACSGAACALPSGVTQIVRQGVTYTIGADAFGSGVTGIREVDAYILRWNPNRLKQAPAVWSPDVPSPRLTG